MMYPWLNKSKYWLSSNPYKQVYVWLYTIPTSHYFRGATASDTNQDSNAFKTNIPLTNAKWYQVYTNFTV